MPAVSSRPLSAEVEREHMARIVNQLERQVGINAAMAQRCATMGAALSVLGGIADSLVERGDTRRAIDEVLAACFDAGGISLGILELREGDARETHVYGIDGHADGAVRRGFAEAAAGCAEVSKLVLGSDAPTELGRTLGAESMRSALVLPLVYRDERIGTLLLAAHADTFEQEEGIAFARGIASQITQAVVLARAFAGMERAQREAREHARVLQSVVDGVAEGIVVIGDGGHVTMATHAAQVILGGVPDGAPESWPQRLGLFASDTVTRFDAARLPVTRALRGEIVDAEEIFVRRPDGVGGERWVQMSARPLIDDSGRPRGAVAVVRDMTKEKAVQAQLMSADRMVTVGVLAAGVAHEINNPLAAVLANLDFVAGFVEDSAGTIDPDLVAATDEARDAASRVRDIVRDLRIFSREEEEVLGPVDVQRVLDSSARMAWTEIKHRARLVKDYRATLPALANEGRLGQVFLNLIVNAAQAIPLGHADQHEIRIRTSHDAERNVVIEVADSGCGMSPEVLARVFTPFFTTKPAGVGTGLGLSICKRLVDQIGGKLSVSSRAGAGTTFKVVLPSMDPSRASAPRVPQRTSRTQRARILVIDDDPLVLSALRRRLAKSHEVRTVHDAREALEVLSGETFDAVLCDLMMPVMSGIDFFREVERRTPALLRRIVFATGGAFTPESRAFLESVKNHRLEKPFSPEELDRVLDRVLGDRAA
jgi:PAS domain S-box-containing protein